MTGNRHLLGSFLLLLLSAAPAFAQLPNATGAGPDASPAAPAPEPPADDTTAGAPTRLPITALPPTVEISSGGTSGPVSLSQPQLKDVHITYGGELTLDADKADADLAGKRYDLSGNVRAHETDTTLKAESLTLGGKDQSAEATKALLLRSYYSIRAPQITATPEKIVAYDGDFTTVPDGGRADYYLHAQTITLDSLTHRGTLRNATLYLFGRRLLTLRRLTFGFNKGSGSSQRHLALPTVGVSSRYGTFLAFGSDTRIMRLPIRYQVLLPTRQTIQAVVTSTQTLYAPPRRRAAAVPDTSPQTLLERIRAAATVLPGPLPEGDPLRFRDFLPDPDPIQLFNSPSHGGLYLAENLSTHVAASGNLRNDLYVSRLPEVTLSGNVPLSPVPSAPVAGDPQSFRAYLRHIVLYALAQETVGSYREQSVSAGDTRARRASSQAGLSTRPLLIAPNTVLLPTITITSSSYSGSKSAYRYDQINVAVNHYFSDINAVGIQFLASATSGSSPFNFDVLDTTRELDLRFQMGNSRLVAAGRIRYDLVRGGVIDYQAALGPSLRGFTPVLSYNFRTRSLGLGIQVKGLTF